MIPEYAIPLFLKLVFLSLFLFPSINFFQLFRNTNWSPLNLVYKNTLLFSYSHYLFVNNKFCLNFPLMRMKPTNPHYSLYLIGHANCMLILDMSFQQYWYKSCFHLFC